MLCNCINKYLLVLLKHKNNFYFPQNRTQDGQVTAFNRP
uniref:Uncharacterized protein n=1 Tax=Rhizophora mucronata TaxID=61149 RepID=A0A2P2QZ58_RHIMU